jgi:hypothetical protein
MDFGPDDFVMLTARWLSGLSFAVVASFATFGAVMLGRRRFPRFGRWRIVAIFLVPLPLAWWAIHSASSGELNYTLTLLNSESSQVAERAYEGQFKAEVASLDGALRLAVSKREAPNVRFYASCLVADFLATNKDDSSVARILSKVDGAPLIETQFFGGNSLTKGFYIPGHLQPELTVRQIVEQRMRELRTTAQR